MQFRVVPKTSILEGILLLFSGYSRHISSSNKIKADKNAFLNSAMWYKARKPENIVWIESKQCVNPWEHRKIYAFTFYIYFIVREIDNMHASSWIGIRENAYTTLYKSLREKYNKIYPVTHFSRRGATPVACLGQV